MKGKSHSETLCDQMQTGEINPFRTLEAAQEHIGATWGALAKDGYAVPARNYVGESVGNPGEVFYHLSAIESAVSRAFGMMAALEPDLYAASEGDMEALARMKGKLMALAGKHRRQWEAL